MTKQEEIREWLAREFYKYECGITDENLSEEQWQLLCGIDASIAIVCGEHADKVLAYLHSQGVVIRGTIDRNCPPVPSIFDSELMDNSFASYGLLAQQRMIKAGYVAVEEIGGGQNAR